MFKLKKAFSLIESLVALFVLSMVTLVYINSSTVFINSQTDLVKADRRDQLADLIIQDIMEYVSHKNNALGTITVNGDQTFNGSTDTIELIGFDSRPTEGDIILIDGVRGRYVVDGYVGDNTTVTLELTSNLPNVSLADGTSVTFIAFKKNELACFDGLNLVNDAPGGIGDCTILPDEVEDLHNHWKAQLDDELGSEINVRSVEVTDGDIVKVTLGDGTDNTVLAKKVNVCIFDETPNKVAFNFPGLADPIETGIIDGSENPVAHYNLRGVARMFTDLDADNGEQDDTTSCTTVNASTCRQVYAGADVISVFLYRYTGDDIRVKPTSCNDSVWTGQCDGVRINTNDLSLWFIFDEYNHAEDATDTSQIGQVLEGTNGGGYFQFDIENLPTDARILVFDDASESCQGAITNGTCSGRYVWNQAHDGMVVHLGTGNLATLEDIELEITGIPTGVDRWRVLRADDDDCLIASGDTGSAHGDALNIEDENECWNYVTALNTTTASAIFANSTSVTLTDSSIFPNSGNVQIGSEYVSYTSNNTATNTLSGLGRGIRNRGELGSEIANGDTPNFDQTLDGQNPQIGILGGFVQINDEVLRMGYKAEDGLTTAANNMDDMNVRFYERALKGTSTETHAENSNVRNYDMRARDWPAGTTVWEGPTNSIPVVLAEDTDNEVFERARIKRRATLNLSQSSVCS